MERVKNALAMAVVVTIVLGSITILALGINGYLEFDTAEASTLPVAAVSQMVVGQVAIADSEMVRYTNETLRPIAEKMRNLDAEITPALVTWNRISSVMKNNMDTLDDGRETEGVSRLIGTDIHSLVNQMTAYKALMDGVGVRDVISKPCVRALKVQ